MPVLNAIFSQPNVLKENAKNIPTNTVKTKHYKH